MIRSNNLYLSLNEISINKNYVADVVHQIRREKEGAGIVARTEAGARERPFPHTRGTSDLSMVGTTTAPVTSQQEQLFCSENQNKLKKRCLFF